MADDPEECAGLDQAARGPFSFTTLPLHEIEDVVDFTLWDTPTSMIPTLERVCRLLAELVARDDAGHPVVVAAIAEAWRFLDLDGATRH
jgi:hypothetical protein